TLFFFSSRRRHTKSKRDWSSDVCSSDLLSATIGLIIAASVIENWLLVKLNLIERLVLTTSVLLLIIPIIYTNIVGMILFFAILRSEERRVGKDCRYEIAWYNL